MKTFSLRLDNLDIPLLNQSLKIAVNHPKTNSQFIAEIPLCDVLSIGHLIQDLKCSERVYINVFIRGMTHNELMITDHIFQDLCSNYEHSKPNAISRMIHIILCYSISCIIACPYIKLLYSLDMWHLFPYM